MKTIRYNRKDFRLRELPSGCILVQVYLKDVDCGSWQPVGIYENEEQALNRIKLDFMY